MSLNPRSNEIYKEIAYKVFNRADYLEVSSGYIGNPTIDALRKATGEALEGARHETVGALAMLAIDTEKFDKSYSCFNFLATIAASQAVELDNAGELEPPLSPQEKELLSGIEIKPGEMSINEPDFVIKAGMRMIVERYTE